MTTDFNYNKTTRKINRMIRKNFGTSCNCFFGYDKQWKVYRLSFFYMVDNKPTQIVESTLNHIFFNSLNGQSMKDDTAEEKIETFCNQSLNFFKDRKNFLLYLANMFVNKFNMSETGAINETYKWQDCILTVFSQNKNNYTLFLDVGRLGALSIINPLAKMTEGLEIKTNQLNCKYKVLELDMSALENLIMLYS